MHLFVDSYLFPLINFLSSLTKMPMTEEELLGSLEGITNGLYWVDWII